VRRLAIYPGTFDPPTLGHLDVIERAARLFDRLIVAVGSNASKNPLLTVDERVEALRGAVAHCPNVEVDTFTGLLVDYAHTRESNSIVRGLRATADFEYEFQMAMVNRRLSEDVDSVFLMTKWEYSYLSSSIVREVAILGGDFSGMVPTAVVDVMRRAIAAR
jgi:pantetheine-phosphate adenylyltransferase